MLSFPYTQSFSALNSTSILFAINKAAYNNSSQYILCYKKQVIAHAIAY